MVDVRRNSTTDASNNPLEGAMPAGLVSDNLREVKGAAAREAKDRDPAALTTGTSTAYVATVTSDLTSGFVDRQVFGLELHTPNGNSPTLSLNGQAAKPIYLANGNPPNDAQLATYIQVTYVTSLDGFVLLTGDRLEEAAYLKTGTAVGEIVVLEDVGGNPGLPAVDGSQLTNVGSGLTGELKVGYLGTAASTPSVAGKWIDCVGTIGSATSGATYANANAQTLFEHLWTVCPDSSCPVSGGRGASANDDWAANKTLALPDHRGRAITGIGGFTAGVITATVPTGAQSDIRGGTFGASTHVLTELELASHTHAIQGPGGEDIMYRTGPSQGGGTGGFSWGDGGVVAANTGGDNPHNTTAASIAVDVWIAL